MTAGLALLALLVARPAAGPMIGAKSAILMDADTGKVLWAQDADTPRPPASTTKVMTSLLLLEHTSSEEEVVADGDTLNIEGASLHLRLGERLRADQMLWGIMLRSANDACIAVAKHVAGSVPKFVQMMNDRALELGCTNTHFANPNGLPAPDHVTTAHDLALIAREAMKRPDFRRVARTRRVTIERSINQADRRLISKNEVLDKDPSADGVKTGYTSEAGHCYVGSATRSGHRLITVVLNSPTWKEDHEALLRYGFESFERKVAVKAGKGRYEVPVTGTLAKVQAANKETVFAIERKGSDPRFETRLEPIAGLKAPLPKGTTVAFATYRDRDGFVQKVPLVAIEDVPVVAGSASPSHMVIATVLLSGVYLMRRKSRRTIAHATRTTRRSA